MFPYRNCVEWLCDQNRQLQVAGCKTELYQNEVQLPTITIKVTAKGILADLVVWEYGRASMQIFDLATENYVLERHDVELGIDTYESDLSVFFEKLASRT